MFDKLILLGFNGICEPNLYTLERVDKNNLSHKYTFSFHKGIHYVSYTYSNFQFVYKEGYTSTDILDHMFSISKSTFINEVREKRLNDLI